MLPFCSSMFLLPETGRHTQLAVEQPSISKTIFYLQSLHNANICPESFIIHHAKQGNDRVLVQSTIRSRRKACPFLDELGPMMSGQEWHPPSPSATASFHQGLMDLSSMSRYSVQLFDELMMILVQPLINLLECPGEVIIVLET